MIAVRLVLRRTSETLIDSRCVDAWELVPSLVILIVSESSGKVAAHEDSPCSD